VLGPEVGAMEGGSELSDSGWDASSHEAPDESGRSAAVGTNEGEDGTSMAQPELDPDELEGFDELDDIKVDVDIDAILKKSESFEHDAADEDDEEDVSP
jgi:hypothetical protein